MWDNYGPGEGSGGGDNNLSPGGYSAQPADPNSWQQKVFGDPNQMSVPSQGVNDAFNSRGLDNITGATSGLSIPGTNGGQQQQQQSSNPIVEMAKSAAGRLVGNNNSPTRFDNMGANLMDLYNKYKGYQAAGQQRGRLEDMFSPNSAYAQRMNEVLSRHDAAAGRRTQIGPRQVELQARLAEMNSRNAPMIDNLTQRQNGMRNGGLADIFRMGSSLPNGGGGIDMLRRGGGYLSDYFTSPPSNTSYDAQNGSDVGMSFADGGPVRVEPKVGTMGPRRVGGTGGGLSDLMSAPRPAQAASNVYVDPMNPRSVNDYRERVQMAFGGPVHGPGGPRSDSVPANLSNNEHVFDAASVKAAGGGDYARGHARLTQLRNSLKGG